MDGRDITTSGNDIYSQIVKGTHIAGAGIYPSLKTKIISTAESGTQIHFNGFTFEMVSLEKTNNWSDSISEAKSISIYNDSISKEKKKNNLRLSSFQRQSMNHFQKKRRENILNWFHFKETTWIDSISEVKMLARVLVALAASVAAEKVKIGEIQTLAHAVRTKCFDW